MRAALAFARLVMPFPALPPFRPRATAWGFLAMLNRRNRLTDKRFEVVTAP